MPLVNSLLDTDLQKFLMLQAIWSLHPHRKACFEFTCRSPHDLSGLATEVHEQLKLIDGLKVTREENEWLRENTNLSADFLWFLNDFKLNSSFVNVRVEDGELRITASGRWIDVSLFEIYVLMIVSGLYWKSQDDYLALHQAGLDKLDRTLAYFESPSALRFSEFGTRRRFSSSYQKEALEKLIGNPILVGTSNMLLAKEYGLSVIGTHGHEWIMAGQVVAPDLGGSQKYQYHAWYNVHGEPYAIALTDTITTDAFLYDFDLDLSQKYRGVRFDSGHMSHDVTRYIAHLKSHDIDPKTKVAVFSDGLSLAGAEALTNAFKDQIQVLCGIGGSITNDIGDSHCAPSIVMKLVSIDDKPVVKISNTPGKISSISQLATERVCEAFRC